MTWEGTIWENEPESACTQLHRLIHQYPPEPGREKAPGLEVLTYRALVEIIEKLKLA